MSVIETDQLLLLLRNMGVADNTTRKGAETSYVQVKKLAPSATLLPMLAMIASRQDLDGTAESHLALTLLRQLLRNSTYCAEKGLDSMPDDAFHATRSALMQILMRNTTNTILRMCASCVSALGIRLLSRWSTLSNDLIAAIHPEAPPHQRRAGLLVIQESCKATMGEKGHWLGQAPQIIAAVIGCLNVDELANEAVSTIAEILVELPEKNRLGVFPAQATPMLIATLDNALKRGDHDAAEKLMLRFSELAVLPDLNIFAGAQYEAALKAANQIVSTISLPQSIRHSAIEFETSLATGQPSIFENLHALHPSMIEGLFQYLLDPEYDEEDWGSKQDEDADEADLESGYYVSLFALDRISTCMPSNTVVNIVLNVIQKYHQDERWVYRAAAITLLMYMCEHSAEAFEPHSIHLFGQLIIPALHDIHPFVRLTGIRAMTQLSSDLEELLPSFGAEILQAACQVIRDPVPRVAALAGTSLQEILESMEQSERLIGCIDRRFIAPYVAPLCDAILGRFASTPPYIVQLNMCYAISTVISSAGIRIAPYAESLANLFITVLALPSENAEARMLQSRAIESLTLLAVAIGAVKFHPWAEQTCTFLIQMLAQQLPTDDPMFHCVLRAWTCMVECLGKGTLPHLPTLFAQLRTLVMVNTGIQILGDEDAKQADGLDASGKEFVLSVILDDGVGVERIKIKTEEIEDKNLALCIILATVEHLGSELGAVLLKELTEIALGQIKFIGSSEVREMAAQILGFCGEAFSGLDAASAEGYVRYVFPQMLSAAIELQDDLDTAQPLIAAMAQILKATRAAPDQLSVAKALQLINDGMTTGTTQLMKIAARVSGPGRPNNYNNDEFDEEDEVDELFLQECMSLASGLILVDPNQAMPLFTNVLIPGLQQLLTVDSTLFKEVGLSWGSEMLEFASSIPQVFAVCEAVVNQGISLLDHEESSLAQVSWFICKLKIKSSSIPVETRSMFSAALMPIAAQQLTAHKRQLRRKQNERAGVIANLVAALFAIHENFPQQLPRHTLLDATIDVLPIDGDETEAKAIHKCLTRWIADNSLSSYVKLSTLLEKLRSTTFMDRETMEALVELERNAQGTSGV